MFYAKSNVCLCQKYGRIVPSDSTTRNAVADSEGAQAPFKTKLFHFHAEFSEKSGKINR